MRDPSQTRLVQACAYAALVLVSLAVTLDAPVRLMGMPDLQTLPYTACFVAAVWMSSFPIPSPYKLSLAVVVALLVCTSVLQVCIHTLGLKEAAVALLPFEGGAVYIFLAYIVAAMLLLVPLLLRRTYPRPDPLRLARALLISLGGMLVVVAALSFIDPISRFFDPLKILLAPYIFPLMTSAVAVLLWDFMKKQVLPKGTPSA